MPGREHAPQRVERQQVAHELDGEPSGDEQIGDEEEQDEDLAGRRLANRAPQGGERPERRDEPEGRPHSPGEGLPQVVEIGHGAEVLNGVGHVSRVAHHLALLADVVEELGIEERIGLAEQEESATDGERGEKRPEPPQDSRLGLTRSNDERADRERKYERRAARLGGEGEADDRSGDPQVSSPSILREGHQSLQGHERDQRLIEIEGDEMGMLDRQNRDGKEERGEKPAFSPREPRAERVDPGDHRDTDQGGKRATDDHTAVEALPAPSQRRSDDGRPRALDVDRKRSVGEEMRIQLELGEGDLLDGELDPPLVGMDAPPFVPRDAVEAENRGEDQDREAALDVVS